MTMILPPSYLACCRDVHTMITYDEYMIMRRVRLRTLEGYNYHINYKNKGIDLWNESRTEWYSIRHSQTDRDSKMSERAYKAAHNRKLKEKGVVIRI
jgi:hypothetical protein